MPARLNLALRFAAVPALVMLALVATLYLATVWLLNQKLRQDAGAELQQLSAVLSDRLARALNTRITDMEQLARSAALRELGDIPAMRRELEWVKARAGGLIWIGIAQPDGRVLAATQGEREGTSVAASPSFAAGQRGLSYIDFLAAAGSTQAQSGQPEQALRFAEISVPVLDKGGRLLAVLTAQLSAVWFLDLGDRTVNAAAQPLQGWSWQLFDSRGAALKASALPFSRTLDAAAQKQPWVIASENRRQYLVFGQPVPLPTAGIEWELRIAQDLAFATAPSRLIDRTLGAFAIAALILFAMLGYLAARRAGRPFDRLVDAANRRFEAAGGSRAMPYAHYLDALGEELSVDQQGPGRRADDLLLRLASGNQLLQRVIENLPMGVAVSDAAFRVQYVNGSYSRLLGWTSEDVRGRRTAEFLFEPPAGVEFVRQFDHLADPPGEFVARFDALRRDGGSLAIQWHMVPLFDRQNRFDGLIAVIQDISGEASARNQANLQSRRLSVFAEAAVNYALVMLDAEASIVAWSRGAQLLTSHPAGTMLGRPFASLFAADLVTAGLPGALLAEARQAGQAAVEASIVKADGTHFIGVGRLYGHLESTQETGFVLILNDGTQARQAAKELSESESRLSAVIASASDAIVSTDVKGQVMLFNPAAERIFQVPAAEMLGRSLDRLLPAAARRGHKGQLRDFADSKVSRRAMGVGKIEGIRADGERIELEASISQTEVAGSTVLTAILRDVTERARADRALVNYQVQLAGLSKRLLVQEKETTQRLAQALHDDLGQTLAALRLIYDAGVRKLPDGDGDMPWIRRLDGMITDANKQVRRVLMELRPPLLDDLGLYAAIDNELKQQAAAHEGIDFRLDWEGVPIDLRWLGDVEHGAFMIAREAINNAIHHARPGSVTVTMRGSHGRLNLSVRDDGRGEVNIQSIVRPGHLGLVGMRERALAIGAVLEIESSASTGTTVFLKWGAEDEPLVSDR